MFDDLSYSASFPQVRMRRLRQNRQIRALVREYALKVSDLILPAFVIEGDNQEQAIASMPGQSRLSIDRLVQQAREAYDIGIRAMILFPALDTDKKDRNGSEALNQGTLICKALKAIKRDVPEMILISDVALDPYTDHGHDGILKNGKIVNDSTVEILADMALNHAKAGADIVAPSDMMDGRIGIIRAKLDEAGFEDTLILSYTAKYASSFYGPFREAVCSENLLKGDKKTYQMDPANRDEALREAALDVQEGADMIMVKPGMPYLDIAIQLKQRFNIPVLSFQVSGEYAMLKAAAEKGWLDYEPCLMESLLGFKRAGCNAIITYAALDAARLLTKKS